MKTKILCIFLIILQLFLPVSAAEIWSETTESIITEGVRLRHEERFLTDGWESVHVLEIDIKNENLSLSALYDSRGISHSKNVLKMAEEGDVVAAVNADFFNWTGTPLGFTVTDGKVISSPSHDPGLAVFMETEEGDFLFDYVDMSLFVTCPEGYKAEIIHINKVHSMESMVLYTSDWDEKTPGSHDGVSELVVEDGIVKEIRLEMDGAEVPENGYVIATSTKTSTYLVDNFKVGDAVELSYSITPEIENIRTAVGGGTVLVKDGKVATFTNVISGTHPRTAIGVDAAGEKLYLVTVDGRKTAMPGFTQTKLAEYMISLGADKALNLDGGGSSTMVAREEKNGILSVVNNVSDGALRPVATAIGVQFTGEKGAAASIRIFGDSFSMLGEGVPLSVMFYDAAENPLSAEENSVRLTSADGKIQNGVFYPSHSGTCTVKAASGKMKAEKTITVLEPAADYAAEKPKGGASVLLLPGLATEKTVLNGFVNKKLSALAKGEETVYTFGKYENEPELAVTRFSSLKAENSLFVTINAGLGSIRETDADQWKYIMEIGDSAEEKNIFFLLSTPLSAFSDPKEAALFERVITEKLHAKGKNVFVISTGAETTEMEKNGVRFITVSKKAGLSATDIFSDKNGGVRFTLEGDNVHFEKVPLYMREGK
ncbi:MAG: phosphodiester glycosidase family protein [Clostridia bacterium]|nr:phosphodiester glycosidase family protein [Clostridia bacterium]